MTMPIQPGTFKRLPPKENVLELIEEQKSHNADITSYMWYIMPVAEKFGDKVYDVAAESLTKSGLKVSPSQLRALAEELKTPDGMARYAKQRRLHLRHVTG